MVKFRGIEVNVISQFDICKLPEFAATTSNHPDSYQAGPQPSYPTAACAVPIYPGSQIWFEYTVDGPHPTGAVYFFKLIINDVVVTSWDCTAKQGFHGKMMYTLVSESRGQVARQALRFGDGVGEGHGEDIAQINVYRVEKRVRIKNIEEGIGKVDIKTAKADGLRLTNSGLLEPGIRPKRYKYQLLDPVDMPYAAFKFHCRSIEYLETHGVAPLRDCSSPPSARSSMISQSSGNVQLVPTPTQTTTRGQRDQGPNLESSPPENTTNTSPSKVAPANKSAEQKDAFALKTSQSFSHIHLSGSDESLSVKTRDSLEDLPSSVTRSPRSPKSPKSSKRETDSEVPPSPTRSPQSPRRRLVKKLTITTNEETLDEEGKKRALSPFTAGGLLRKASVPPRTAPASVTEFGPTVEEEVMAKIQDEKSEMEAKAQRSALRTTAEERGGKKLIGFLSRRFAGEKGTGTNGSEATWPPIALVAAILANPMGIDHTSRLKEMISMTTGQGLVRATTDLARLTDEVLRMTPAGHKPDQRKESSTSGAAPEVRTDDVRAATRDETDTTPRNPVQTMTNAAPLHLPEGEDTMTETLLAHHETIAAGVEADTAVRQKTDHQAEAKRISSELKQYYNVEGLDDVRVIRDRQTKQSRQFGFLRFATLQEAEDFMDRNYPTLYLYGDSSKSNEDASKVRIAYGKERKDPSRSDDPDWICANCSINNFSTRNRCFRCQAEKPDPAISVPARASNVGDNDASPDNQPSQFLLLRGLEPSVSEEILVKGVSKMNKPSTSANQRDDTPAKKGAKVASTTGDANLGAREGTLRRVLLVRDRRSNESWRYGFAEYASIEDAQAALVRYNSFDRFTIASKQVLVSYIHAGVFVPVLNPTPDVKRFCFSPIGNPSLKLAYWDEAAYVTELAVSMPNPARSGSTKSSASVLSADPGLKPAKDTDKSTKKRKAQPDTDTAAGTSTAKKPAPSHLQFWSNRHAELHGIKHTSHPGESAKSTDGNSSTDAPPSQSYADPTRHCCYLCLRQFNSAAEVNKHERLSDLHRTNLADEAKVQKAEAKLAKHGIHNDVVAQEETSREYRDRARERRKIYGVVNKKGEQVGKAPKPKSSRPSSPDDAPAAPVQSKGASLLSKMGYTAGQGLGASGEGMTAPISQDVYVAGVGLGAQGGKLGDAVKEAERNTKGDYGGFLEETRKRAKERYERMG